MTRANTFPKAISSVVSIMLAVLLAFLLIPAQAFAATPSITISSDSGSNSVYSAVRIADAEANPIFDHFDWDGLHASDALGSDSADSAEFVTAVSRKVETAPDESYVVELAGYADASSPDAMIPADGEAHGVANGWYILIASAHMPMLAWVDDGPVALFEKSDAPVHVHSINHLGAWQDVAVHGAHSTIPYKVEIKLPNVMDNCAAYPGDLDIEWDEDLIYDAGSAQVRILSNTVAPTSTILADIAFVDDDIVYVADPGKGSAYHVDPTCSGTSDPSAYTIKDAEQVGYIPCSDCVPGIITDRVNVTTTGNGMSVVAEDLKALGAKSGDALVVTYTMHMKPNAATGITPMTTRSVFSHLLSPVSEAITSTPVQTADVYSFKVNVKKTDSKTGDILSGAKFVVRDGDWYMASDGMFSKDRAHAAIFTTGADGMITNIPNLGTGSFELVEVESPNGYQLTKVAGYKLDISADLASNNLGFKVSIDNGAKVETVDSARGVAVVNITNDPIEQAPPGTDLGDPSLDLPATGGDTVDPIRPIGSGSGSGTTAGGWLGGLALSQTGDVMFAVVIGLLAVAAVALVILIILGAYRRKKDEDEACARLNM